MTDPERIFRRLIEEGFNGGDLSVCDARRTVAINRAARLARPLSSALQYAPNRHRVQRI